MRKNRQIVAGLLVAAGTAVPVLAQTITITQNTSPATLATGSVACAAGGGTTGFQQVTTDNQYWRSFNLSTEALVLAGGMNVTEVQFGVEQATLPPGTQTVNVDLFKDTNGGAPVAVGTDLVLVGSGTVNVANGTAVFSNCTVAGAFAKTDFLVVRVSTPDYLPTYAPPPNGTNTNPTGENAVFFVGSNALGQSAPCYISSVGCALANPATFASVGFPNVHVIINVTGTTSGGGGGTCYANCDSSTIPPCLNVNDFVCFNNQFSAGSSYANCDQSTIAPILNVNDFVCFNNAYSARCGAAGANDCLPHP